MTPTLLLLAVAMVQPAPSSDACRLIEPTRDQRAARFANAYAFDAVAIRTLAGGTRSCEFTRSEGQCRFGDPKIVHLTLRGQHSWFAVDQGRDAVVSVSDGAATCRMMSRARR